MSKVWTFLADFDIMMLENQSTVAFTLEKQANDMAANINPKTHLTNLRLVSSTNSTPNTDELRNQLISNVATTMAIEETDLRARIADGAGNLVIKSKVGVAAIAQLQYQLGCILPGLEHLKREQVTSIEALVSLAEQKLKELNHSES
jgi:hypothetical protein